MPCPARAAPRFPPPWSAAETDACFFVCDANGRALGLRFESQNVRSPRCRFTSEPFRAKGGVEGACVSAVRAPRLPPLRTMSFVTDCYAAEGIEGRR